MDQLMNDHRSPQEDEMTTKFTIGQRVRHTEGMTSLPEFPPEDAIPPGSIGTVDYVTTKYGEGYGVVFDCDPHKLSAYCEPAELEGA